MREDLAITITEQDHRRLHDLVTAYGSSEAAAASGLLEELDRATVVPAAALGPAVVTMNSRVTCRNEAGALRHFELVYPGKADAAHGRISVLAPLGRALIGAVVGSDVTVEARGRATTWRIEEIRYQPEAAGDFSL